MPAPDWSNPVRERVPATIGLLSDRYHQIRTNELEDAVRQTLQDVFVNWLEQRLKDKGKEEIEKVLLGELSDSRETQSGKDLIRMGKDEGKIEALLCVLETKFGAVDAELRQRIEQIDSADKLTGMLLEAVRADSFDQLNW